MKLAFPLIGIMTMFFGCSCKNNSPSVNNNNVKKTELVNALIEIPSGSVEKWELNKTNNKIERDSINNQPRTINYLGYPANYGMIPNTLLPKNKGGDGDPLDILVLGPQLKRGSLVECTIIGVLHLLDSDEKDDKLIAIANSSSLNKIKTLEELNQNHKGITEIIETWFCNYKGKATVKSLGYENKEKALNILEISIDEYNLAH